MDTCFIPVLLSLLFFSFICSFGSLTLKNKRRLEHTVKLRGKIVGVNLKELSLSYGVKATKKAQAILAGCTHPLYAEYKLMCPC